MKTQFYSLIAFLAISLFSINAKAQGSIASPTLNAITTQTINCLQVDFNYLSLPVCSLAVGTVLTATLDYGDGTLPLVNTYTINTLGCDTIINFNYISHIYAQGTYTPTVTMSATGATTVVGSTVVNVSQCNTYSGNVYFDANANCILDAGDVGDNSKTIYLKENGVYLYYIPVNSSGFYSFSFPYQAGYTYTLERDNAFPPLTTCSTTNIYTLTPSTTTNLNFAEQNISSIYIKDSIQSYTCGLSKSFILEIYSFNIPLSATYTLNIDYGDGTNSSQPATVSNTNGIYNYLANPNIGHTYPALGNYTITMSCISSTGVTNSFSEIINVSQCNTYSGYVYFDANSNCILDAGDVADNSITIHLKDNGINANFIPVNSSGFYSVSFQYQAGHTYTLERGNAFTPLTTCSTTNIYTLTPSTTTNLNFAEQDSSSINITDSLQFSTCGLIENFMLQLSSYNIPISATYTLNIDYGDGTNSTQPATVSYTNGNYNYFGNQSISHTYSAPGNYTVTFSCISSTGVSNSFSEIINVSQCNTYSGYVYFDANSNCILDAGDVADNSITIYLKDNGINTNFIPVNSSGFYSVSFPYQAGHTYSLERNNAIPALTTCSTTNIYTLTPSTTTNLNFAEQDTSSINITDSLQFTSCGLIKNFIPIITSFNIPLSASYTLNIDYGDGTNSTQPATISYTNGTISYFNTPIISHTYSTIGNYTVTMSCTSSTGVTNSFSEIINASLCGTASGNIFNDINGNCIKDGIDTAFTDGYILILDNSNQVIAYGYPDAMGDYTISFPYQAVQTFIVQFIPNNWYSNCYMVTCPTTLTYVQTTQNAINENFAVMLNTTNFDNEIGFFSPYIYGATLNAGNTYNFYLDYENLLCASNNATIDLTLDPNITFVSSITPFTQSGNIVTFNVGNVSYYNALYFTATIPFNKANGSPYVIGDSVCFTATIIPTTTGDVNLANNTLNKCFIIGTAYDPNDKSVSPKGIGAEGIVAQNQTLEYTVHFQNTGNAQAQNVVVKDVIDANLDITTLEVIASSHFMNKTIAGNKATFTFPNIMLPDSGTNNLASNGFVRFSIKPKLGLPTATKVKNTASIYFDANAAIVTNTVKSQLGNPTKIDDLIKANIVTVTPNPAHNLLEINFIAKQIENSNINIYNSLGQIVAQQQVNNAKSIIDISTFANGFYTIQIIQNKQQQMLQIIKE